MRNTLIALAISLPLSAQAQQVSSGTGGALRVLDKVTGIVTDMDLGVGARQQVGLLSVLMTDCRYPTNNPSGDAYAALTVTYRNGADPVFSGWMVASAPALNAMDHPRYDVWVLGCTTS